MKNGTDAEEDRQSLLSDRQANESGVQESSDDTLKSVHTKKRHDPYLSRFHSHAASNVVNLFGFPISADSFRYISIIFCFVGLQLSYVTWGVVQERIMTKEYVMGRWTSATFLVFNNRALALLISLAIVSYRRLTAKEPMKEAPFYHYAPSSISNSVSSWAQYEALKYVSFPTQVLSKSCKILPVMLVGIVLNGVSYPLIEYMEAFLITVVRPIFMMVDYMTFDGLCM